MDVRTAEQPARAAGSIDQRSGDAPDTVFSGTFEARRQLHLAAQIDALVAVERGQRSGELATA